MTDALDLHEYVGVLHVHSVYSDGSGTVEDILAAAEEVGLDFVVLTDHNTLEAREAGYEGRHGSVLLLVGDEVSGRDGHCLALGLAEHVDHRQPPAGMLAAVARQSAISVIAHPHGRYRPLLKVHDHAWKDWSPDTFTGLELWSYMFDWARDFHYARFLSFYRNPDARITGPEPETLALWDRLCAGRRVVAIGGVDAHAKRYPLLPFVVFPYRDAFRTVRTHVLSRTPMPGDEPGDRRFLLDALGNGHAFLAYDKLCDSAGTRFGAADGSLIPGDETVYAEPVSLRVQLPVTARIRVLLNGDVLHETDADGCEFLAAGPGVYRVEARIEHRPWLFTNPIYLRPAS